MASSPHGWAPPPTPLSAGAAASATSTAAGAPSLAQRLHVILTTAAAAINKAAVAPEGHARASRALAVAAAPAHEALVRAVASAEQVQALLAHTPAHATEPTSAPTSTQQQLWGLGIEHYNVVRTQVGALSAAASEASAMSRAQAASAASAPAAGVGTSGLTPEATLLLAALHLRFATCLVLNATSAHNGASSSGGGQGHGRTPMPVTQHLELMRVFCRTGQLFESFAADHSNAAVSMSVRDTSPGTLDASDTAVTAPAASARARACFVEALEHWTSAGGVLRVQTILSGQELWSHLEDAFAAYASTFVAKAVSVVNTQSSSGGAKDAVAVSETAKEARAAVLAPLQEAVRLLPYLSPVERLNLAEHGVRAGSELHESGAFALASDILTEVVTMLDNSSTASSPSEARATARTASRALRLIADCKVELGDFAAADTALSMAQGQVGGGGSSTSESPAVDTNPEDAAALLFISVKRMARAGEVEEALLALKQLCAVDVRAAFIEPSSPDAEMPASDKPAATARTSHFDMCLVASRLVAEMPAATTLGESTDTTHRGVSPSIATSAFGILEQAFPIDPEVTKGRLEHLDILLTTGVGAHSTSGGHDDTQAALYTVAQTVVNDHVGGAHTLSSHHADVLFEQMWLCATRVRGDGDPGSEAQFGAAAPAASASMSTGASDAVSLSAASAASSWVLLAVKLARLPDTAAAAHRLAADTFLRCSNITEARKHADAACSATSRPTVESLFMLLRVLFADPLRNDTRIEDAMRQMCQIESIDPVIVAAVGEEAAAANNISAAVFALEQVLDLVDKSAREPSVGETRAPPGALKIGILARNLLLLKQRTSPPAPVESVVALYSRAAEAITRVAQVTADVEPAYDPPPAASAERERVFGTVDELDWFLSSCWNLALQLVEASDGGAPDGLVESLFNSCAVFAAASMPKTPTKLRYRQLALAATVDSALHRHEASAAAGVTADDGSNTSGAMSEAAAATLLNRVTLCKDIDR